MRLGAAPPKDGPGLELKPPNLLQRLALWGRARRETKIKVSERSATWRVQTHHSRTETEKKTKGKSKVEREGQAGELSIGKASVLETSGTGAAFRHHWRRRH